MSAGTQAHMPGIRAWRNWTPRRILALALMLIIPITLVLGSASGAFAQEEDEDDAVAAMNFYRLSSSVTALFSEATKPKSKLDLTDTGWPTVFTNASSGGSMVGYVDSDFNPIAGWLNSKTAQSSDAIGYGTLMTFDEGTGIGGLSGAQHYSYFGATLNGMGLDSTSTGLSLGFFNTMLGGVIMLLYILTAAVDGLFSIILTVMDWLNPFKLFYVGVNAVSPEFANGMTGGQGPPGFLGSLAEWVGGWYQVLNSLSWTVLVPIFMSSFVMGILLFKKMDKGSGLKKLFIRLFFIGLGLPLLGSMYTGMLGAMNTATDDGNAGSTKVVLSTYVDFEGWALDQRLRIPDGATIEWNNLSNQPSGASQANVRDTALLINAQVFDLPGVEAVGTDIEDSWNEAIRGGETDWTEVKYGSIMSMLWRYMGNEQVSASSFETESKSTLSPEAREKAPDWFEGYMKDPEDLAKTDKTVAPNVNPLLVTADGTGLTLNQESGRTDSNFAFYTAGDVGECGRQLSTPGGAPRSCNLAPLAMYNYLNTDFGSTSLHTYSSGRSSSEATRSVHNSVSMVGTGTMSFIYWFNAVVLLGSFVLIGFGYAFSMIMGNLRRGLQLVTAIPFATLGAIAGIAKVIVYSIALIMEVIITIFLYKFVQEFLIALPSIFEKPFAGVLNNGDTGNALMMYLGSSGLIAIIITLAAIVLTIMFTVMALRARKSIVKAIEEATTKIVEKFVDSSVGAPGGGGGMMPALAGGAAAGAGAAIGNRMMSGGGGSGKKSPSSNAGGANGPGAIAPDGSGPEGGGFLGGNVDTDGALDSDGTMALAGSDTEGGAAEGADAQAAEGSQGSGSPMGGADGSAGADGSDPASETELGKQVESSGLSNPTGDAVDGAESGADGSSIGQPAADGGTEGGNIDQPAVGDGEAMDAASGSMQDSQERYKEADQAKLSAGTEGAQAAGHGALAAGRAVAGDEAGAAKSAGDALDHGGQSASADARARQASADAGKSSLDSQNTQADKQRQQQIKQGQQVSSAGKTVSGVAGAAGGAGGGTAPTGGKAPTGGGKTPSTGGKGPSTTGGKALSGTPSSSKASSSGGMTPSTAPSKPSSGPRAPSSSGSTGSGGGRLPSDGKNPSGSTRGGSQPRMSAPAPKQQASKPAAPPKRATAKPAAPAAKPAPTQQPKHAPTRRSSGTGSARDGVRKAQGAQRRATQLKRKGRGKGGKKLL
ncbi:hypothetical protein [Brachybacterium sp. FME24]|uniref:hypothetical protein n=1 Tax=Brachybacterium sp. FME24 TaxID=2742605 RepID=UPI001867E1A9|nr:hypothetical protein [Brachybacterium sp. FME24]